MKNKKILVTGAAGFIGSQITARLSDDNKIVAVDNGSFGITDNIPENVEFHNRSVLEDDLPTDVDTVYHFADISADTVHEQDRTRGVRVSINGFVNVVEQALESGCSTVVYPSTGSLYIQRDEPVTEAGEVLPATAHQAATIAREKYAEYFMNHYDLNMAGIRLFPVYYGYREEATAHIEYPNTVAQFADAIAHARPPTLYGDGSQKRDFTHINDVVRGIVAAGSHHLTGIYNLGSGRAITLNELISMIANELQMDVEPQYIKNTVPKTVPNQGGVANYTKLREEVGWEPQIPIEEGIERVCASYQVVEI